MPRWTEGAAEGFGGLRNGSNFRDTSDVTLPAMAPIIHESVHQPHAMLPLHRHAQAYAALVLDGAYEERSVDGCFKCTTGDLVIHPPLHAHRNSFPTSGAVTINFPVPVDDLGDYVVLALTMHQDLERLARTNPTAAGHAALEEAAY